MTADLQSYLVLGNGQGGGAVQLQTWGRAILIGFTYIGTIVGAGFASGQEILQFFTLYGKVATITILISSFLFLWLGTKIMVLAKDIQARSYEDLNVYLFGETAGKFVSLLMFILLLAISTVMLAGAGSVFHEHFHVSYQSGLLITVMLVFIVMTKGMNGIKIVNTVVVPFMLLFMLIILMISLQLSSSENFMRMATVQPMWRVLLSPFMYTAFNLALAQAVLVPLGATAADSRTIRLGGLIGGSGITIMLLVGHISLSAHMPGIAQFDLPMSHIISPLGPVLRILFVTLIYAEIFTTLIADIFGLNSQLAQHIDLHPSAMTVILLTFCYTVSQFGFKTLLSTLYPLLGLISLVWLSMLVMKRRQTV